jgi:hypothetical protein
MEEEGDSYLTLTPGAGTPDGAGVEPGTQRQEVGVHHLRPEPRARLHQGFNQIKPFLLCCWRSSEITKDRSLIFFTLA